MPPEEYTGIVAAVRSAQSQHYRNIAAMDRDDKIRAGAYVYFTFLRPFARGGRHRRRAGVTPVRVRIARDLDSAEAERDTLIRERRWSERRPAGRRAMRATAASRAGSSDRSAARAAGSTPSSRRCAAVGCAVVSGSVASAQRVACASRWKSCAALSPSTWALTASVSAG